MEKRRLGRTGYMSSVVILGGATFSSLSQAEADEGIEMALEHGVNHFDVAPTYGEAELRLGPWVEKMRDKLFLGCKTGKRDRQGAAGELQRSLERLRAESSDLYQLHGMTTRDDLDAAVGPGGAIEALLDAREKGLTRHIGITGHSAAILLEALRRFDFDTIMFPLNLVLYADEEYRANTKALLAMAAERNAGVMCIKSIAKRSWGAREHSYRTWYEPFDDQGSIDHAVWFVLSQPVTGIPHASDLRLMRRVICAAGRCKPMSEREQAALVPEASEYESIFAE